MGRALPKHLGQAYCEFWTRRPLRLLHRLCTHSLHLEHWMELFPTPLLHTAQGNFPVSFSTSSPTPEIRNFVFDLFAQRPFFSMAAFHAFSLLLHCSSESAMITRSSAYKSSHGAPVRNSHERASSTRMNSSGLRMELGVHRQPRRTPHCIGH